MTATEPTTGTGTKAAILMVDDRADNLLALEAILQPLQHPLVRAMSGEEALRRLLTDEFAVILLDVQMPGLDGFETAAHIKRREKTRHIPIIFLTAMSREIHHQLRGYGAGAVDYLAKPFEPEVLRAKVAVFLELYEKNELLRRQSALLKERLEERDRAQAALARQATELERSNAELEQFAHVVSHDLQEPLHTMAGFLNLIAEKGAELDEETKLYIDRALAGADRMRQLILDLLAYSRVSTKGLDLVLTDAGAVLTEALGNLHGAIASSGATVTHDEMPTVLGDAWQLGQLFQNLLGNALKFHGDDLPEVHVGVERLDDEWLFSVRDNGIGIDPRYAVHIFTVFQRLHRRDEYDGTGIGLAICRKIVERHGGRIWVESDEGRGATFYFTLKGA